MSAYNGARYLPQQIDSILAQSGVKVSLLVRDDGSNDRTLEILRAYEKRYQNISVYMGNRKGAAAGFYDLLDHADLSNSYYAFADQDDVWMADKLLRAVTILEQQPKGQPLLYAGKVICASKDLAECRKVSYHIRRGPSFGNALAENICMGCTEVFNARLLKLARGHLPEGGIMHDWWLYLTAAYFGKVVYDHHANILYRQHGDNAVGMQNRWGARWIHRAKHIRQMQHKLSGQAIQFQNAYGQKLYHVECRKETAGGLCKNNRCRRCRQTASLDLLCGYRTDLKKRCRIVLDKQIYRQSVLDDVIFRMLFMIGFL
ncbi:MAG: glycosyltransferase [Eubacterium sp.]|nr:glycosyltransferase [Eubacterium sp.]